MTPHVRRKSEFARRTNERASLIWSNSYFRWKPLTLFFKKLMRSTVNDTSQSAAAGADTRSSHSTFDSAFQMVPLLMHSAIVSVASA
jgi:hypothetical protein